MELKDTIHRFFLQQCNAEEAGYVLKYFDENPKAVFEYISETEWENFQANNSLTHNTSAAIWQNVQRQTKSRKAAIFYLKRTAVAASVLLAVALTWYLIKNTNAAPSIAHNESAPIQRKTVNNHAKALAVYLGDGTEVQLMSNSSLSYPDTFMTAKRDVVLNGEAVFRVAKSPERPFTVYGNILSVTALGTIFKVSSHEESKNIQITLLEGRVVIKAVEAASGLKDVYLNPGEIYTYNKISKAGIVSKAEGKEENNVSSTSTAHLTQPQGNVAGNNWYKFNNQSLAETFDQLSLIYGLKIEYNKAELRGMTFIGKIDKSDSIRNILLSIALLNDLKVEKTNTGYRIKK